jgi:hypothetical protein
MTTSCNGYGPILSICGFLLGICGKMGFIEIVLGILGIGIYWRLSRWLDVWEQEES